MPPNIDYIERFSGDGLKSDAEFIKAELRDIYTEYKKVAGLVIKIQADDTSTAKVVKSSKDAEKGFQGMSVAVNNLENNVKSLNSSQQDLSKTMKASDDGYTKSGQLVNDLAQKELEAARAAAEWYKEQQQLNGVVDESAVKAAKMAVYVEEAAVVLSTQRVLLRENMIAQKAYNEVLAGDATEAQKDKAAKQLAILTQEELEYRVAISAVTKELKIRNEVENATKGSRGELLARNKQLTLERDNTADPTRVKELNDQIDKNNALIGKNSTLLEKQKINIGNYPTVFRAAFNVLNKELDEVNAKIAAGAKGDELRVLTAKQIALNTAIEQTGKDFNTTTAQSNAFKKAAELLGSTYGTNSKIFKDFTKEVGSGAAELKHVSSEVASATGGTNKLVTGFKGLYSVIRNIAYIVPGLGISGIILLLLAPLKLVGEAFVKLFDTINYGKDRVQALNAVNEKSIEGYIKQVSNVQALVAVHNDHNTSLAAKKQALEDLIKLDPDHLKGITEANLATQEGRKILDEYINSLQRKATVEAALAVNADANKAVAMLVAEKESLKQMAAAGKVAYDDLSEAQLKYLDKLNTSAGRMNFTSSLFNVTISKSDLNQMQKNIDEALIKLQSKSKASLDVFKQKFSEGLSDKPTIAEGLIASLKRQIAELDKSLPDLLTESAIKINIEQRKKLQAELDRLEGKEKKEKDLTNKINDDSRKIIESYEARRQAILKQKEAEIEDQAKGQERIYDSEKNSLQDRLTALSVYQRLKQKLIKLDLDEELSKINADEKKRLVGVKNATLRDNILKESASKRDLAIAISGIQTRDLIIKKDDDYTKIILSSTEEQKKAYEELYKSLKESIDKNANLDSLDSSKKNLADREAIEEKYRKGGFKSKEDYEEAKLDLEKKYHQASVFAEILKNNNLIKLGKIFGKDTTDLERKNVDLKKDLYDKDANNFLTAEEKKAKREAALLKKRGELAKAAATALKDIVDSLYDREIARIEEKKDQIDKETARQLEINDAIVQSEDEKQNNINQINKKAQLQKEALDRRQKEIEYKKAQFDRLIAVASIVADTARAVAKDLVGNKFLIPYDIAIGAIQIAAILAKPLPKFKTGLDHDYEGLGYVGDGGQHEVHEKADGSIEVTPNVPTITQIKKGDRIYSSIDQFLAKSMRIKDGERILKSIGKDSSFEDKNIVKGLRQIERKIANKETFNPSFRRMADFQDYVEKFNSYKKW